MKSPARPHVLFLVHRIPYPPDKGDKIRSHHELLALKAEADVSVATFVDDPADETAVEPLKGLCAELIAVRLRRLAARARSLCALPGRRPLSLAYYRSARMVRQLRALGRRRDFDAVLVFSSTMAPYAGFFPGARRVLDLCDLDSRKWAQFAQVSPFPMSAVYGSESRRLGRFEVAAARAFDATLLVSEYERRELARRCPHANLVVVPNGVDLEYFDPAGGPAEVDPNAIVFCGAMDYRSNVDAVLYFHDEILPLVRAAVPEATFRIVGSNPAPEVRALAATPGVTVTGRVPDVRPELLSAAVSVAPLRLGRGVPNKILEALALTLPVVTTPNGAAGLDLDAFPGADVAETPRDFATAVIQHLRAGVRHPEHRRVLKERYSWAEHGRVLRRVVLSAP